MTALRALDTLPPLPFVLVVGIAGGLLQSVVEVTQPRGAAAMGLGLLSFALIGAALWLGVRRRRYAVWSSALQLAAAGALAALIGLAVAMTLMVPDIRQLSWPDALLTVASGHLVMGLNRFLLAFILIYAGRHLPGIGPSASHVGEAGPDEHRDAVT